MTYQNLGYWIAQANDLSTGTHPTGWASGQRWSATASQWQTMYGTSQSDLATMTSTANTWHTRADQAWGDTRVWNSSTSFEADRNYWKTTVAHDDPNVWTNRYSAGYTQATTDKQPAAFYSYTTNVSGTLQTSDSTYITLALPISGYWSLAYQAHMGDGADGQFAYFELRRNGGMLDAAMAKFRMSGVESYPGGFWVGQCNAGDSITIVGHAGGFAGTFSSLRCAFTFVPTQAQPH